MSRSREDQKKELAKTQAEYDQSLQKAQENFNELKQCVNKYSWRRNSKCIKSGIFDFFQTAVIKSEVLERERDKLASNVPEDLSTLKSMHSSCVQKASRMTDYNELVMKKGTLYSRYSGSLNDLNRDYMNQLIKCATLQRKQEKLQESKEPKETMSLKKI